MLAHRWAWSAANGDPGPLNVLHRCDNRLCVNVEHLFLGTQADNMRDMDSKGRRGTARGEQRGTAKLTESDVRVIRSLNASGGSHRRLAAQFGVSKTQVGAICTREKWAWLA
jgi:hypothetical protein